MNDKLLRESKSSRTDFFRQHGRLLDQLVRDGQHPQAFFITCSDSRITPEGLFDLKPGDWFVLRNVANAVPPYVQTEIAVVAALEFALLELNVPHIIVCGHTDCGGVKALDQHVDLATRPALSRWIDLLRPAQQEVDFAMGDLAPEERHRALVEQNVIRQLANLRSYPFVRERLEAGQLQLHGWVYDLAGQRMWVYDGENGRFTPN